MPEVSVVVCTVNRPDLIESAVKSVLDGSMRAIEVVVVDQSPDSRTRDALGSLMGDERLFYLHSDRVGLSAAYNTGIRATSAEILAFTDDDCIAPTGWAQSVADAFVAHPDVELMYGRVAGPSDMQSETGVIPTLDFRERRRMARGEDFEVFGMGANFAARRTLFSRIGGFDEILGGGGPLRSSQDFDLQFRAYRGGAVCLLEPTVWVTHYGLREHHRWPETMTAYGVGDGGFYMKHVRCGDLLAARLLAGRVTREAARVMLKPLLRRKHSAAYLRGVLRGARGSFRYSIDRSGRTYVARPIQEA
ncbi:MAG: glycosyltransferase family 2 protein [Tepidiformaceae bacterium]